jgi:hypothetical protein
MQTHQNLSTFVLIGVVVLIAEMVLFGGSVSGSAISSLGIAAGGTVGVAYRRHRRHRDQSPS